MVPEQKIPRKVVVVLGVRGIGLHIARRLAVGRLLIIADDSDAILRTTVKTLRDEGHDASGHYVNITDYSSVVSLAKKVRDAGSIEAIILAAHITPDIANTQEIFEYDLLGAANCIEAFQTVAGPGTSMVCVACMSGHMIGLSQDLERHLATASLDWLLEHGEIDMENGNPSVAYAIAMRGFQLRVQASARAWGMKGARLNSISPGVISNGQAQNDGPAGARGKAMVELSAAQRMGTPDDVANAVDFLLDPRSDFINGNDLLIDGGAVSGRRWHS